MSAPKAIKRFVVDTSVLLHDPQALFSFEAHRVILPLAVLDELGKVSRTKEGELADNARHVLATLDHLRQTGRGRLLGATTCGGFFVSLSFFFFFFFFWFLILRQPTTQRACNCGAAAYCSCRATR